MYDGWVRIRVETWVHSALRSRITGWYHKAELEPQIVRYARIPATPIRRPVFLFRRGRKTTTRDGSWCRAASFRCSCSALRGQKLLTIGFHQVEENLVGQFTVTGGAGGEKEERIFLPDGIRVLHLVKQLVRIGKLRVKSCADFFSNLIAAALNARADCRLDITGPGTEAAKHLANAFFDNSFDGAAPAGMEDANRMSFHIHQDYRKTVCRLNADEQAGTTRDQAIPDEWLFGQSHQCSGSGRNESDGG